MNTILGLDLGKFKSMMGVYRPKTQEAADRTIATDPPTLRSELQQIRPDLVAFETGTFAGWVSDLCVELGLNCLVAFRHRLVGRRTAIQNHICVLGQAPGVLLPVGHRAWTAAGRRFLANLACHDPDPKAGSLWRLELALEVHALEDVRTRLEGLETTLDALSAADERTRLLETIPGVGRRTAEVIAADLDEAGRFSTAAEVSVDAGLVPRRFQSGETNRQGRITKRGSRLLRKMLVEAAWLRLRYNAWAARLFTRLVRGQKSRRKSALVAVARKLLGREPIERTDSEKE